LREKLIKIGAQVVAQGYVAFQMAEVAISRQIFQGDFAPHRGVTAAATTKAGLRCSMIMP
jgi:hypothetical protein